MLCSLFHIQAQTIDPPDPTQKQESPSMTMKSGNPITQYERYHKISEVIQIDGRTFNETELERMPDKDINKIANTVSGVQLINGNAISIKGADPSGTAYFVDGVRVYGALPILTK
jgi:hypothetical protein